MSAQPQQSSRTRVLFVDDEPRVLNSMRIMFRKQYDTFFADNGAAALGIVKAHDIDVIVCDHRMPQMTGVEVLAQARELSPRSVRILLTGYADLNAVEGSINESEVFRFLTKPCAPDELRRTIALASSLAHEPAAPSEAAPAAYSDENVVTAAEAARTEAIAVSTQVLDEPAIAHPPAAPTENVRRGLSVLVFANDESVFRIAQESTRGRVPVYYASNIVQVVRLIEEHQPGVLLTDISEDRSTIQAMTARLKQHLPQLVTIAVSEHRDVLDMVWLINHGQIFRFLRKPLSPGRCAVSLKAGLEHHQKLLRNPDLVNRYAVEQTDSDKDTTGLLARLGFLRRLWNRQ
ncbi:MAG: response regulator [Gammaproteobacteria bacterium]|jgi:DNA-binding NtrC family response regulator